MASAHKPKTAHFVFGRFNPVTIGHREIFEIIAEEAKADKEKGIDAHAFVFVSNKINANNPLPVEKKIEYIEQEHGDLGITFVHTYTNIPQAIHYLQDEKYTHMIMYVGSDYNSTHFKWVTEKYPFVTIKITKRGNKISATKSRNAARRGNVNTLMEQTGFSKKQALSLIRNIKAANTSRSFGKAPASKQGKPSKSSKPYSKKGSKKGGYQTRKSKK